MHRRSIKLSSDATATQAAAQAQKHSRTIAYEDASIWLRDNHYLRSGYLPPDPNYLGVIPSLTYLHNQSLNIYTHLLPALTLPPLALAIASTTTFSARFNDITWADHIALGAFFTAAEFCLLASAAFHLLLNHSQVGHDFWLRLDLAGIVAVTVGSFVPGLYYGFFCDEGALAFHLGLIIASGSTNAAFLAVPAFRTHAWHKVRVAAHVALGLSGFIPLLHGTYMYGLEHMMAYSGMPWYLLEAVFYMSGVAFYTTHVPERWVPRMFDIWGASHQIFHVCIVVALCCHLRGVLQAFHACHTLDMCAMKRGMR